MTSTSDALCRRERQALADLLNELGPDAPTLCEGWRSADLAAHLYVRDHRPDAGPGMVSARFRPLAAWTDRVRNAARDTMPWDALVAGVRSGPPSYLRPVDQAINTIEYFVHHEDLRRAQAGWQPRELAADDEAELWRRTAFVKAQARIGRLKPGYRPPAARLEATGTGAPEKTGEAAGWGAGAGDGGAVDGDGPQALPALVLDPGPGPVVRGRPSEIILWLLGRRAVARVEVS